MNLLSAYQLLQDGTLALGEVERRGVRIDVAYCDEKLAWIEDRHRQAERRFSRSPLGLAWDRRFGEKVRTRDGAYQSTAQLRAVLGADFGVRGLKETEGGEASADDEALRRCGVEGADYVRRMRRLKKMRDALRGLRRAAGSDGYAHPSFLLHTVSTYRSSAQNPNLQNQPKRDPEMLEVCRRAIVPSPGHRFLEVDFKGVEVSVAACYHQDPAMLAYLRDPASDMHGDVAVQTYGFERRDGPEFRKLTGFKDVLRQSAKNGFVFPQFYGDYYGSCAVNMACSWLKMPHEGEWSASDGAPFDGAPMGTHLRDNIGVRSLDDFTRRVKTIEEDFWGRRFRVYDKWRQDWYAEYQRTGEFEMKTGFRVSGLLQRNQVINFPVQGAAFHALLWVLIRLVRRLRGWRSGVVAEVHDSALIDAHPDEFDEVLAIAHELVEDLRREWTWLIAPMSIESSAGPVDGSWAEVK